MSEITPQRLMKRIQSPQKIKPLLDFFGLSKIKMCRKVYNLQTRNIKKFIKDQKQIQSKQKAQDKFQKKQTNSKKRYDQNQLLELQYKIKIKDLQPVFIQRSRTQPSQLSDSSRKVRSKINLKSKLTNSSQISQSKFKRREMRLKTLPIVEFSNSPTKKRNKSSDNLPHIILRKKSISFMQNSSLNPPNLQNIMIESFQSNQKKFVKSLVKKSYQNLKQSGTQQTLKIQSKLLSNSKNDQQKLIQITDDKMSRYIRALHILINKKYQHGMSLSEQKVNNLLIQRYSIKNQCTQQSTFQLPFMQFISEAQTRKSIHRIVNMSVRNTQKIVFKLLDFNGNGFIDQKDLISLIQLSQRIHNIKADFLKIIRYLYQEDSFSISNTKSVSYREDSYRQIERLNDTPSQLSPDQRVKKSQTYLNLKSTMKTPEPRERSFTYATNQISDLVSGRNAIIHKSDQSHSISFNRNKLYLFLESKNNFFQSSKNNQNFKVLINIQKFYQIFGNQRPTLFYDILQFLFKIRKQDIKSQTLISQFQIQPKQPKKQQKPRDKRSGFKNYDVPLIIKDMQKKFQCNIQNSRYKDVLHIQQIRNMNESTI